MTRADKEDTDSLAFWHRQKWDQSMVVFAIYSDLPNEPALQAVWDNYQVS